MPICPQCGARHPTLASQCINDGAYFIQDAAWQASRQDSLLGTALNQRFVLVAPLGRGNMGTVYDARDLLSGQRAAVKILLPELTHDAILVRRFRREADAISRMHHPNIVQLYAFGQDHDTHYIAMEFVEGRTLASFIPYTNFSRPLTLHLIHQLLLGLTEAHAQGIIHRDLKPDNIFLCARPDQPYLAKILDFGLAKLSEGSENTVLTATGEVFGTPLYISPEQATAQSEVTSATDIYTLGVILFELLSGAPPFNAPSPLATMMQHVHSPPPRLVPRPPLHDLTPALLQIISCCLEKDPSLRFPSAQEALDSFLSTPEMRAFLTPSPAHTSSLAHAPAIPLSFSEPQPQPHKRELELEPELEPQPSSAHPPSHTRTILYGQPALRLSPSSSATSPYRPPHDDPDALDPLEHEVTSDEEDTTPEPISSVALPADNPGDIEGL
jgi:eukaryotic-like serine/threonine-protein kinase